MMIVFFLCFLIPSYDAAGMLFPQETETRSIQELNGMWDFKADMSANRQESMENKWWTKKLVQNGPVLQMPVPSSYNDITTNRDLRDFTGWVWYEREVFVRQSKERQILRIDSAHYYTIVYVNGMQLMEHVGGHLPFEAEINHLLDYTQANRITIAVNNTLGPHTLPPGSVTFHHNDPKYPPGYFQQNLQFDFFNYAGIHRRVRIYSTPMDSYIDDIDIVPTVNFNDNSASVSYDIKCQLATDHSVRVSIEDMNGKEITSMKNKQGKMIINNVHLWRPYSDSGEDYTYRYKLKVSIVDSGGDLVDVYRQSFGVRDIKITENQVLINNKPFYCHGAAKHEDSDLRGKGLDFALIARDFNMMRWLGMNCFRTSHYPYAEEILEEADKQGFVVINECPGVGIKLDANFAAPSLSHHLEVMDEFVRRDKNKPSVIFWSVANEPDSANSLAEEYFRKVINHTRSIDPQRRPVTFVSSSNAEADNAVQFVDVICFNRYFGWYQDTGRLQTIATHLTVDLEAWHSKYKKPLIITEFGADTVVGLHTMPSFVFTEEYQAEFLHTYHTVFDQFRSLYLAGEMVWNFADFMTDQTVTRVVGNRKGLLTRQRQPKMAAFIIRQRYWSFMNNTKEDKSRLTFVPWTL